MQKQKQNKKTKKQNTGGEGDTLPIEQQNLEVYPTSPKKPCKQGEDRVKYLLLRENNSLI